MANGTQQPQASYIEHYLKLYDLQKDSLDERRAVEWKVALGLWGAIGIATGFLYGKVHLPAWGCIFYIGLFVTVSVWLFKLWHSNQRDHYFIDVYRSHAEFALGMRPDVIALIKPKVFKQPGVWGDMVWWICEVIITALLLLASFWLLVARCSTCPTP